MGVVVTLLSAPDGVAAMLPLGRTTSICLTLSLNSFLLSGKLHSPFPTKLSKGQDKLMKKRNKMEFSKNQYGINKPKRNISNVRGLPTSGSHHECTLILQALDTYILIWSFQDSTMEYWLTAKLSWYVTDETGWTEVQPEAQCTTLVACFSANGHLPKKESFLSPFTFTWGLRETRKVL